MIILLYAVLATTVQSADPFRWEFDLTRCDYVLAEYDCFSPVNGQMINIRETSPYKRINYEMYPHVFAFSIQSFERWVVTMQSRSRKQKIDSHFGMIVHRQSAETKIEEDFLGCRVVNGTIELLSSPDLETELIDSYFDENVLYCDYAVRIKNGNGKTFNDIISEKDRFAMSVSTNGVVQKYKDDYDITQNVFTSREKNKYIATHVHDFEQKHKCNLSQARYDPKEAPKGGKVRSWEVFENSLMCTDSRYIIHVIDSKGRKLANADISCEDDGLYEISDHKPSRSMKPWKIEKGESFNAFCHVEDKNLCPLTVPCDGSNCPYVKFQNIVMEYKIDCTDTFNSILVIGEYEYPFVWNDNTVYCNWQHDLIIHRREEYGKRKNLYETAATEGYCANKATFYHPNCTRRYPLCNGKACDSFKNNINLLFRAVLLSNLMKITCTLLRAMTQITFFQDFSAETKQWIKLSDTLRCNGEGYWNKWFNYARCKDPADTNPPIEWTESQTASKKDEKTTTTNNEPVASKDDSTATNGQTINVSSIALMIVYSMLIVH